MAQDFYPFVENGESSQVGEGTVRHPARIAVYDDAAAAPRVVVVEPTEIRPYLEEITLQVTQLAQAQGGSIPFMVIREIVENFIHAYFMEPTISILDGGNTIRFSDQGPGIAEKDRALQYGTTSATEEMKRYIRGVGSGLPYAQQYMRDKGGSLRIDDNIAGGTVVTISTLPDSTPAQTQPSPQPAYPATAWPQPQAPQGWPQTAQPWATQQGWPNQQGWPSPWPQAAQQGWQQQPMQPMQQAEGFQPTPQQIPQQGQPAQQAPAQAADLSWVVLSARGKAVVNYLAAHDTVGPSDLSRAFGESQPTWTRELQALEEQGLVRKDGQKRRLTSMGRTYVERHGGYLP
jgi:hypothetical protein